MIKSGLTVAVCALTLAGCNSIKPSSDEQQAILDKEFSTRSYVSSPKLSKANNVLHAASMMDLDDARVSAKDYSDTGSKTYNLASLGFNWVSGNIGLIPINLTPKPYSPTKHNKVIYWQPAGASQVDVADRVVDFLHSNISDLKPVNASVTAFRDVVDYKESVSGVEFKNAECKGMNWDGVNIDCAIALYDTTNPSGLNATRSLGPSLLFVGTTRALMPDFIAPAGTSGTLTVHTLRTEMGNDGGLPTAKLDTFKQMAKLSAALPDTAYIYLAPKGYTVTMADGEVLYGTTPLLLNKGELMQFVVPKG